MVMFGENQAFGDLPLTSRNEATGEMLVSYSARGDFGHVHMSACLSEKNLDCSEFEKLVSEPFRQVSLFTVARRLHKDGVFARRTERCITLKVDHLRNWCKEPTRYTRYTSRLASRDRRALALLSIIKIAFDS
ncbi:hypothetical protein TNCV_3657551 [Trichonephila clavipes]|nr:hypothetical protein TNCV_3657551 [Trichonephila clavipes]